MPDISLCAWQNDVNVCALQENRQCERFACSRQKGVNDDKKIAQFKNPISIVNQIAG